MSSVTIDFQISTKIKRKVIRKYRHNGTKIMVASMPESMMHHSPTANDHQKKNSKGIFQLIISVYTPTNLSFSKVFTVMNLENKTKDKHLKNFLPHPGQNCPHCADQRAHHLLQARNRCMQMTKDQQMLSIWTQVAPQGTYIA